MQGGWPTLPYGLWVACSLSCAVVLDVGFGRKLRRHVAGPSQHQANASLVRSLRCLARNTCISDMATE
eukprot:12232160-Prorocentrum_lima.AAC.1